MSAIEIIATAFITTAFSCVVIVLKTDIGWIKDYQKDHENRIRKLEEKIHD